MCCFFVGTAADHTIDLADEQIPSVKYGPAGDVIAWAQDGRIHFICTKTGTKILCLKGHW